MNKKIIYLVLFVFSVWFFWRGIPIDIFHSYPIILSLVAGIVTTFLLTITLFQFSPANSDNKLTEKQDQNLGCILIAVIVAFFFAFSIYLIFDEINRTNEELEKNGVYTTGVIVSGSSFKTRKVDLTSVVIQFKDKKGKVIYTNQDISASEFARYSKNQEIPIVYSEKYPSILKILRDDKSIEKFSKTPVKDLSLNDLISIFELKSPEQINKFLNTVNKKWDYQNAGEYNSKIYFNKFKNIAIKVNDSTSVIYMHNRVDPNLFEDELSRLGFKRIDEERVKGLIYRNDNYLLSKRVERIESNNPNDGPFNFKQLTVIEMIKLK